MAYAEQMHLLRTGVSNAGAKRRPTIANGEQLNAKDAGLEKGSGALRRASTSESRKENLNSNCELEKARIRLQQKQRFEAIQESVKRLYEKNEGVSKAGKEARLEKARTLELETKARNFELVKTNVVTFDFSRLGSFN